MKIRYLFGNDYLESFMYLGHFCLRDILKLSAFGKTKEFKGTQLFLVRIV